MIVSFFLLTQSFFAQQTKTNAIKYTSFEEYPVYLKEDLGCTYTPKKTTIKLWSPNVEEVKINLYKKVMVAQLQPLRTCSMMLKQVYGS